MDIKLILEEYDDFLARRDYERGGEFLALAREAAEGEDDPYAELTITNELIGHHRKNNDKEGCYKAIERTLELIDITGTKWSVSAGTGYINIATGYNRFGDIDKAISYYRKAESIFLEKLGASDERFGGLYNNLATALQAKADYSAAAAYYDKAIRLMHALGKSEDEAITYVNFAHLLEESGAPEIDYLSCLNDAFTLLDGITKRDGYYAFVCEKCAPSFAHFGDTLRADELNRRAAEIYGSNDR